MYSVAQGLADFMIFVPAAFATVTFPIISKAHAEGDFETVRKTYETGFLGSILYVSIIVILAEIFALPLIVLAFGRKYLGAVPLLQIGIFASAATCLTTIIETTFRGIGRPDAGVWMTIIQVSFAIVLLPLFASSMGCIGAALLDDAIQILGVVIGYWEVKRITGFKIRLNWKAFSDFFKLFLREIGFSK